MQILPNWFIVGFVGSKDIHKTTDFKLYDKTEMIAPQNIDDKF